MAGGDAWGRMTMKVALLGVGYWGAKLLRNLVGLVGPDNVIAVDSDPSRLAWVRRHYPSVICRSDLDGALADSDVEAVIVATPVKTHADYVRAALEADRHVLVEKPFTTCTAQAVELAELADRRGRVLMVGHTFLFSPRVRWIVRRLNTTGIGKLHYLMSSRLNLGTHRDDASVLWDLAPHDVAIVLRLLGESPATVRANARSVINSGIPDVAFVDLTFPSGVIASLAVSWLAPRKVRNLVLVGDESMIVYDDTDQDEPVKVYDKGMALEPSPDFGADQLTYRYGDTVAPHIAVQEPIMEQITHFIECAESGKRPISDGWFGVRVVATLEAADRSWHDGGRSVAVDSVTAG
ncbi:Gfo/Idh/MocA family protein [Lentzea sp. NPDC004789]|jgi:predicted dehydrogenase